MSSPKPEAVFDDQHKAIPGRSAEVLASKRNLDVGVLCDEFYAAFETP
jgi:hypothetical protein